MKIIKSEQSWLESWAELYCSVVELLSFGFITTNSYLEFCRINWGYTSFKYRFWCWLTIIPRFVVPELFEILTLGHWSLR